MEDLLFDMLKYVYKERKNEFSEFVIKFIFDLSDWCDIRYKPNELEDSIKKDLIRSGFTQKEVHGTPPIFTPIKNTISNKEIESPASDAKRTTNAYDKIPIEIQESLKKFKEDHPDHKKVGFIMMQFGKTDRHTNILIAIRKTLAENGLIGLRADEKSYHDDNYYNILTYLYGCGYGVAVFEIITKPQFNPNISLEVGYLLGLNKPVCLLKKKSLKALHSDLVGKLYRVFDIENCDNSILMELSNWLFDKGLIPDSIFV